MTRSGLTTYSGGNAGSKNRSKRILLASLLLFYAFLMAPPLNLSTRTKQVETQKVRSYVAPNERQSKSKVSFILQRPTAIPNKAKMRLKGSNRHDDTPTQSAANKKYELSTKPKYDVGHRPRPRLVWLMTFPNSGTTYTLALMEQISNYSMATNYMVDAVPPKPKFPVYKDHPEGPFWRGPHVKPLPDTNVLVKTHCDGYRANGAVAQAMPIETFVRGCGRTRIESRSAVHINGPINDYYNVKMATRAVHIVRNPFHNVIAYFHHTGGRRRYENSREGFRSYCKNKNADFMDKFRDTNFTTTVSNQIERTLCHDCVISYVMWHNHAFEATPLLQLPTLLIHYEDYEDKFDETVSNLLDFLELPGHGEPLTFSARHDYEDYYTQEDRDNIKALAKQLASKKTWEAIERYFD